MNRRTLKPPAPVRSAYGKLAFGCSAVLLALLGFKAAILEAKESMAMAGVADPVLQASARLSHGESPQGSDVAHTLAGVAASFKGATDFASVFHELRVAKPLGRLAASPPIARELPSKERLELRFEPRFVFEAVARQMAVPLPRNAKMPAIRLASETSLQDFQNAVEGQWSPAPLVIGNVYSVARNEVYLDDHAHHPSFGRTLDDALAHEFVHFFQSQYLGDVASTEEGEEQAVVVQLWFRGRYTDLLGGR